MNSPITLGQLQLQSPLLAGRAAARFGQELASYGTLRALGAIITPGIGLRGGEEMAAPASDRLNESNTQARGASALISLPEQPAIAFEWATQQELAAMARAVEGSGCLGLVTLRADSIDDALALADRLALEAGVSGLVMPVLRAEHVELLEKVKRAVSVPLIAELPRQLGALRALASDCVRAGCDALLLCAPLPDGRAPGRALHGPGLLPLTLAALEECRDLDAGLIAQGGIGSAADLQAVLAAGASAAALDTELFASPTLPKQLFAALRDASR